jgi:hypothetical protein
MELYDSKAEDFGLRFEKLGDVCNAHAIAVVFDDGEDGASGRAAGNFLDVMAKIFAMNFDPGIEGGIIRSSYFSYWRSGSEGGSGIEKDREG